MLGINGRIRCRSLVIGCLRPTGVIGYREGNDRSAAIAVGRFGIATLRSLPCSGHSEPTSSAGMH